MRQLTVLLSLLLVGAGGKDEPRIQGLHVRAEDETLLVSFELSSAFDDRVLEQVQSGLPTEFRYVLRLERPRWWWFDNGVGRATLDIVAMYNAVTQEYLVNTKLNGKLINSRVVTEPDELEQAMTLVHSLPAFEVQARSPARLFLKVRAELGSRHFLLLFPRTIQTAWARLAVGDSAAAL